jgi:hypothetical protein
MNLREAIGVIARCVVQVSGETRQPVGTGFFVHEGGYVVTALRVLRDIATAASGANRPVQVNVGIAGVNTEDTRASFAFTACRVVDADDVHDLALLQLRLNPFAGEVEGGTVIGDHGTPSPAGVIAIDPSRPNDGEAIAVAGYPLPRAALVTNAGHLASVWEWEPGRGSPSGETPVVDWYVADLQTSPASAGAPAFRVDTAEVIGVCGAQPVYLRRQDRDTPATVRDAPPPYGPGITVLTPAKYVVDLLSRHGLGAIPDDD